MDRRTLLAISICFVIFLGWQKYVIEPQQAAQRAAVAQSTTATQSTSQSTATPGAPITAATTPSGATAGGTATTHRAAQLARVSTRTGEALLSDGAQLLSGWDLTSYKLGIAPEAAAVDLSSVTNEGSELEFAFDDPAYAYLPQVQGKLTEGSGGAFWTFEDSNIKLTREAKSNSDQPWLDVKVTAEFKNGKLPRFAFVSLGSASLEKDPEANDRQLMLWSENSAERHPVAKSVPLKPITTPVKFIAASNRYFVLSVVNESPQAPQGLFQPSGEKAGRVSLVYPVTGNSITIPLRVYFGPKELNLLRDVDPAMDHIVDFGFFTVFAYPLLTLLKWLYQFVHNYGVAIILLTVLLKIVTYPLTYKSMRSMREMAKLQPQLQKIREKYKDDKEALNREMMTLMRSHGYNPAAGCLPMIIQMPVFFALYRVLYNSIELYHTPFALWIQDLSFHDPYYVTPVLLSLMMFLQQRLTPSTATDPAQQKMMQFMPLIFGAFMISLPSGLTLYMLTNAVASIIQQLILNKKLGMPNVPVPATAK